MISLIRCCNLTKHNALKTIYQYQRRWFETSITKSSEVFRQQDKLDEGYKLIYQPPESRLLLTANLFFTCSAMAAPTLVIPYCYVTFISENPENIENVISSQEILMPMIASLLSMVFVYFVRSFPMRIYKNKEQYVAILPGWMPNSHRHLHFNKGDVHQKDLSIDKNSQDYDFNESGWFKMGDRRVFLVSKYFDRLEDLFEMFADSRMYIIKLKRLKKVETKDEK